LRRWCNEIEVTNIQIDQLDAQLVYFSEAERKIKHILLLINTFGSNDKSGLVTIKMK
jgi:hypothetical protein